MLEDKEDDKLFLIENIEKVSGKRINKTELLYNYPKLSKINFHEHIDKKPDYVLLVRL